MQQKEKAPKVGPYHILSEVKRDPFGILYTALKGEQDQRALLRVLSPEVTQAENFTVRFELLKPILPSINHKNLLQVTEMGEMNGLFFIAYAPFNSKTEIPQTLKEYDPRENVDKNHALYTLFEGIAQGLIALEKVKNNYYKDGIIHSNLTPDQIYIEQEKTLLGKGEKLTPKIGGYFESFLFFGESPSASLQSRFFTHTSQIELQPESSHQEPINLFSDEHYFTPSEREGKNPSINLHLYSFGSILYETITRNKPQGIFPSIAEVDSTIDSKWSEITTRCLSTTGEKLFATTEELLKSIRSISSSESPLTPFIQNLKTKKIPEGMSLIVFHEKVTLGANDGPDIETPAFKAKISPFFMDTHPVTCLQFSEFMPDYAPSSYSKGDDHPAVLVSWYMAKAYCQWRSRQEGLPEGSYRLPTQYEWEAAVRGTTGDQYPWGSKMENNRLWCNKPQHTGAIPTKKYPPGRFGLYNMLGNIWEWVDSPFTPHPFSKQKNGSYSKKLKVVKGGCWITPYEECRATLRAAFNPNEKRGNIGFRCVREI